MNVQRASRVGMLAVALLAVCVSTMLSQSAKADTVYGPSSFGDSYLSTFGGSCHVNWGVDSNCYQQAWSKTTLNPLVGTYWVSVEQLSMTWSWGSCGLTCETFGWQYESTGGPTTGATSAVVTKGIYHGSSNGWTVEKCVVVPQATHKTSVGDFYYTRAGIPQQCPQVIWY